MRKLLILGISFFFLIGCGSLYRYAKSGEVGWALKKAVRDEHKQEIVLKDFTPFKWDEFFIFNPYTSTEEVCKQLGLNSIECKNTIKKESTDDSEMLLVFRQQGKVVHVEMHFRWHGDFTPAPDKPFTPANAVFIVKAEGKAADGSAWLRLRQKTTEKIH